MVLLIVFLRGLSIRCATILDQVISECGEDVIPMFVADRSIQDTLLKEDKFIFFSQYGSQSTRNFNRSPN